MLAVLLPLALLFCLALFLRGLAQRPTSNYHRLTVARGWTIERRGAGFTLFTASLNDLPRSMLAWLGPKGAQRLLDAYDVGAVIGVAGMIGAVGAALWAWAVVWLEVWDEAKAHASVVTVIKRAMETVTRSSSGSGQPAHGALAALQPLIPGISVPLSHLPTLVLALVLNQLFHELGHALTAAIDGIHPNRFSFDLSYLVPSATVAFPSTVDFLLPRAKIRLATSGPFHNLITAALMYGLVSSGVGALFWRDVSNVGRVIYSVDPMSPLYDRVEVGEIVSQLDGISLGGAKDIWTDYLSGAEVEAADKGWCLASAAYDDLPSAPCTVSADVAFFETMSVPPNGESRCLPVSLVGQRPMTTCPCVGTGEVCVRPTPEAQVLRITLESAQGLKETLFWQGDKAIVLDSVKVGSKAARWPQSLVLWGEMFLNYLTTASLSLFLLNLLPLPYTDGAQLLTSLLDYFPLHSSPIPMRPMTRPLRATLNGYAHPHAPPYSYGPTHPHNQRYGHGQGNASQISLTREYELNSDDEDIAEEGRRRAGAGSARRGAEDAWKRRVRRGVEGVVLAICIGWAFGWAFLALLRSS